MTTTPTAPTTCEDAIRQFNPDDWNSFFLENYYNMGLYEMLTAYVVDRFPELDEDGDDYIIMEETIGNATSVSVTPSLANETSSN